MVPSPVVLEVVISALSTSKDFGANSSVHLNKHNLYLSAKIFTSILIPKNQDRPSWHNKLISQLKLVLPVPYSIHAKDYPLLVLSAQWEALQDSLTSKVITLWIMHINIWTFSSRMINKKVFILVMTQNSWNTNSSLHAILKEIVYIPSTSHKIAPAIHANKCATIHKDLNTPNLPFCKDSIILL